MKSKKHDIIALIYDFDGTLAPGSMFEETLIPAFKMKSHKFWSLVDSLREKERGDGTITFLRVLIETAAKKKVLVTKKVLEKYGTKISYFKGVGSYFTRINKYLKVKYPGIELRHYIISSGLKEILDGTKIAKYFHNIFGSEYHYGKNSKADFPKTVINDTVKTQYIFRISKDKESPEESVNTTVPAEERAVHIKNMIYIGDGFSDVPCMTVVHNSGGHSIAVYASGYKKGLAACRMLLKAERVDFIAEADYSEGSKLTRLIKQLIDGIVEEIRYSREKKR